MPRPANFYSPSTAQTYAKMAETAATETAQNIKAVKGECADLLQEITEKLGNTDMGKIQECTDLKKLYELRTLLKQVSKDVKAFEKSNV